MKPGDTLQFLRCDNGYTYAYKCQIKQVLWDERADDDEHGLHDLLIVRTFHDHIVTRIRYVDRPPVTWHVDDSTDMQSVAKRLDLTVPLHVRALRELDLMQYVAEEV